MDKPQIGDTLYYKGVSVGKVTSVDENLCHGRTIVDEPILFIWKFKDGWNTLFTWGKS